MDRRSIRGRHTPFEFPLRLPPDKDRPKNSPARPNPDHITHPIERRFTRLEDDFDKRPIGSGLAELGEQVHRKDLSGIAASGYLQLFESLRDLGRVRLPAQLWPNI
jgi:hypothetical protein